MPLSVYEPDADRARAGDALTEQEQLDRAVAILIREIESGTEERMILTELPKKAVPAHVRQAVVELPTPRTPGTGVGRSVLRWRQIGRNCFACVGIQNGNWSRWARGYAMPPSLPDPAASWKPCLLERAAVAGEG
ncbi:hypothetical protein [Streptomyces tsukubensis]|uniref:Uncharacterized protein n=1 Tax=Streptomyces tsukubensis TaxID=83656 RepID=A0A1V4AAS9_9ACTN|nr:hypothetical protein [Streptomyces tsukubensis]OON80940.1 hypothetical protein B1H18_11305 [Streptomyces tsukubensis]